MPSFGGGNNIALVDTLRSSFHDRISSHNAFSFSWSSFEAGHS
jgi:hypothetical protein